MSTTTGNVLGKLFCQRLVLVVTNDILKLLKTSRSALFFPEFLGHLVVTLHDNPVQCSRVSFKSICP